MANILTPTYFTRSLRQSNPIQGGCSLYLPLWSSYLSGAAFNSIDDFGHLCTRTGGVWGNQGITMDGDDYIEATAPAENYTASDFTILMWIYPTTLLGDSRLLFCRGVYQTDGYRVYLTANGKLNLETNQAAAQQTSDTATGAVIINKWQLVGATRAGAVGKLWVDAVDVTSSSASHVNPLTSARTLKLCTDDTKAADFFIGITGEVYAVGKDLGQAGINQYRQATRWRYGV